MFGSTANKITGAINKQYNGVEYYFHLKKTNDSLAKANERLYNMLAQNYLLPDSADVRQVIDTLKVDSIKEYRRFIYREARVIANSVTAQNNYMVLYGPQVSAMRVGMGVVDANNAVLGAITEVNGNYAVLMSLLHSDSKQSGKLLKTGQTGTVTWDGKNPDELSFTGISKGVTLAKGDSVISSGFSAIFPKGLLIGRVKEIYLSKESSTYRIVLTPGANFHNVAYGYAIENVHKPAIDSLLKKAKQKSN